MVAALIPTGPGTQIVVDRAVVLIGRSADCDSVIDFSTKISRQHCILVQVDTEYFIRDLASMNGVWINGQRIKKVAKLAQGDAVDIGDVSFRYHANIQVPPRGPVRTQAAGKKTPVLVDDSAQILDAEIIDDVEIIEDVEILEEVEIVDDIDVIYDIVEVVEVVDEFEIVDDIEVIDDDDIIEDVQIFTEEVRRPRRPPRLR